MSAMDGKADIARMHGESLRAVRAATRIVARTARGDGAKRRRRGLNRTQERDRDATTRGIKRTRTGSLSGPGHQAPLPAGEKP